MLALSCAVLSACKISLTRFLLCMTSRSGGSSGEHAPSRPLHHAWLQSSFGSWNCFTTLQSALPFSSIYFWPLAQLAAALLLRWCDVGKQQARGATRRPECRPQCAVWGHKDGGQHRQREPTSEWTARCYLSHTLPRSIYNQQLFLMTINSIHPLS